MEGSFSSNLWPSRLTLGPKNCISFFFSAHCVNMKRILLPSAPKQTNPAPFSNSHQHGNFSTAKNFKWNLDGMESKNKLLDGKERMCSQKTCPFKFSWVSVFHKLCLIKLVFAQAKLKKPFCCWIRSHDLLFMRLYDLRQFLTMRHMASHFYDETS